HFSRRVRGVPQEKRSRLRRAIYMGMSTVICRPIRGFKTFWNSQPRGLRPGLLSVALSGSKRGASPHRSSASFFSFFAWGVLFRFGIGFCGAAVLLLLAPILLRARNGEPAKIRFEEISAKAGVRHLHHTRKFQGKNADVLGMFTSGGSSVAVGDYDN